MTCSEIIADAQRADEHHFVLHADESHRRFWNWNQRFALVPQKLFCDYKTMPVFNGQ
jgi:hypothetical protein